MRTALSLTMLGLFAFALVAPAPAGRSAVDFKTQIKPIFDRSCTRCHAQGDAQGQLELDTPQGIKKGGVSGKLYLPGKSKQSLLVKRIKGEGDGPQMPKGKKPLKTSQIELIAKWIDEGAKL